MSVGTPPVDNSKVLFDPEVFTLVPVLSCHGVASGVFDGQVWALRGHLDESRC